MLSATLVIVLSWALIPHITSPSQEDPAPVLTVPVQRTASTAATGYAVHGFACPDVMVVGVRGSGEQPQSNWTDPAAYDHQDSFDGAGEFNYDVYQRVASAVSPALQVSLDSVMYPADDAKDAYNGNLAIFEASADSGATAIVNDVQHFARSCGNIHFVLSGYSQGAWAIHKALRAMNTSTLRLVAGVVLFGDPDLTCTGAWAC